MGNGARVHRRAGQGEGESYCQVRGVIGVIGGIKGLGITAMNDAIESAVGGIVDYYGRAMCTHVGRHAESRGGEGGGDPESNWNMDDTTADTMGRRGDGRDGQTAPICSTGSGSAV